MKNVIKHSVNVIQIISRCTSREAMMIEAGHKICRTSNRGKKDLLNGIIDQILLKNLLLLE